MPQKKLYMNINKLSEHVIVICSHSNTDQKKQTLLRCIESCKSTNIDIILSSHFPELSEVYSSVNYYIYDKNNTLITNSELLQMNVHLHRYCKTENKYGCWKIAIDHGYAVLLLMRNGTNLAKTLNKKYVHCINYDTIIDKELFFKEMVSPLDFFPLSCISNTPENTPLMNTVFFSFEIGVFYHFLNSIHSKAEYCKKYSGLEERFCTYYNNLNIIPYFHNYPQNLINLIKFEDCINMNTTMFDDIDLCSTSTKELYIHIKNGKSVTVPIKILYDGNEILIDISKYFNNFILLGKWKFEKEITISDETGIIYSRILSEEFDTFYEFNTLIPL